MLILAIPTLHNYEGLGKLLQSLDHAVNNGCVSSAPVEEIWILDNGNKLDGKKLPLPYGCRRIEVFADGVTRSVAQSWNYLGREFLRRYPTFDHPFFVMSNDDIEFHDRTLSSLVAVASIQRDHHRPTSFSRRAGMSPVIYPGRVGFALFVWEVMWAATTVGWFDEAFYPAYWEDIDYARRLELMDMKAIAVDYVECEHAGSQTIELYRDDPAVMYEKHDRHFMRNQTYYEMKWGRKGRTSQWYEPLPDGRPSGDDTFVRPFENALYNITPTTPAPYSDTSASANKETEGYRQFEAWMATVTNAQLAANNDQISKETPNDETL